MPTVSMAAILRARDAARNRANVMSSIGRMTYSTPPNIHGRPMWLTGCTACQAADSRLRLNASISSAAARSTCGRAMDSNIR
jgi:hypothetical protein